MPNNRDTILLETVKTHRARLVSAFLYGEQSVGWARTISSGCWAPSCWRL
jgi:hypothetical protein